MTVQISDTVRYESKSRTIVAVDGVGLFNPRDHGVEPFAFSTACHRGYHCVYLVDDESLYLTEIHIGLSRSDERATRLGRGPSLFGQVPRRYVVHGHRQNLMTGESITSWESPTHRVGALREPVSFDGGLLVVAGLDQTMMSHVHYHPIYRNEEVHELVFDRGRLLEARDLSTEAQAFRTRHPPRSERVPKLEENELVREWLREHLRFRYR